MVFHASKFCVCCGNEDDEYCCENDEAKKVSYIISYGISGGD